MLFYMFGFSPPLHCVSGGDKQCNAEEGDIKLYSLSTRCFMELLMLQYLDKRKTLKKLSFNFEE